MKTSENEDEDMIYRKARKQSLNPVYHGKNRESLRTAVGKFVRGGNGNLEPVDIGWEEASRRFVEYEMLHKTTCDDCPCGPFDQCDACLILDNSPTEESRPRKFELTVQRRMSRDAGGNLAWRKLPLFS